MKFKDIDSTIKVKALRDGVPADVELRFASQPTLYSPSIVLRSQLKPIRDLNVVGFLPRQVEDLEVAYSQKRGIIVVTGATGSGKTNTLESIYAKLEETDKFKIIEIGEPIEIRSDEGRRSVSDQTRRSPGGMHSTHVSDPTPTSSESESFVPLNTFRLRSTPLLQVTSCFRHFTLLRSRTR